MVCNSVQLVNDFGVLCYASGNFKSLFRNIASSDNEGPVYNIKPLCPTRWLVRIPAIRATLQQYGLIRDTHKETRFVCSCKVSARALGLYNRFQDGATIMCLTLAQRVIEPLECLNKALQSTTATVAGMLESTTQVKAHLVSLRTERSFEDIMREVEATIEQLKLEPLCVPRRKQPPKRLSGPATAYHPATVSQHYMVEYFKLLDVSILQLSDRIIDCPGIKRYCELESILVTGHIGDVACQYPELASNGCSFQSELDMFRMLPTFQSNSVTLNSCADALRNMVPAMRLMFPTVEALVRLLLVNPASSASAERSFSSLRRLKTYIRSTCGQLRLNNIAMCHIHKHILDEVNVCNAMREFVKYRDNRSLTFGQGF